MQDVIIDYLKRFDLDVRKSHDARFMDQKVTPDVLCLIADCVVNFIAGDYSKTFTVNDIWNSQFFNYSVTNFFDKPNANNPAARHEYDKFIQQPLKALSYAHVLECQKQKNRNIFKVQNTEILEYIAVKDRNAYNFLYLYIVKVMDDSGMLQYFEQYKQKYESKTLNNTDFMLVKEKFQTFVIGNTPIRGETEVKRIFPKIFNIYAAENSIPGSIIGRMSEYNFYFTDLMYNRINWRDKDKDKNLSRQEADVKFKRYSAEHDCYRPSYSQYLITKNTSIIRRLYKFSEVKDGDGALATQVHHIFPQKEFPQIAHYLENMIALTPAQHYGKAHPLNNTHAINRNYQNTCLVAKADSIQSSIKKGEEYYTKSAFVKVTNIGLDAELSETLTFTEIKRAITNIYNNF